MGWGRGGRGGGVGGEGRVGALPVNRARMDVSAQPLHSLLGTMSPNKGLSAFPRGEPCFSLTRESEAGKREHCSGSPAPIPQRPGPFLCLSLDLPPPNCSLCTPLLHTLSWPGENFSVSVPYGRRQASCLQGKPHQVPAPSSLGPDIP